MTTNLNASWMPAHGRHRVNIGTSLGRALKARKGAAAATKRNNLPDRDFYSFRCRFLLPPLLVSLLKAFVISDNFKPPSIDSTKPGTIDIKRGKDSTSVSVELSSSQVSVVAAFWSLISHFQHRSVRATSLLGPNKPPRIRIVFSSTMKRPA